MDSKLGVFLIMLLLIPQFVFAQNIFEPIVKRMYELGIINAFLLFLFSAIFFAILNKSKALGESVVINAIVSFIASFLIFIAPILMGINLVKPASLFFVQSASVILFLLMGVLLASFFYPDLPKMLARQFVRRTTFFAMLGLGIALFVTSGLISTFWLGTDTSQTQGNTGVVPDVVIIAAGLIIFVVVLMVASAIARGGGG